MNCSGKMNEEYSVTEAEHFLLETFIDRKCSRY